MSVALSEVRRAARAHLAPLAGESAGYLVLAIADQVLSAPRRVASAQVVLNDDGGVRLLSAEACVEAEAERSLRQLLDRLLTVASSGSAALTRASRRLDSIGLPSLVHELEAALIPVNRGAARRALARVHRETARALESGALPPEQVSEAELAPLASEVAPEVEVRFEATPPIELASPSEAESAFEEEESPTAALPIARASASETQLDGVLCALKDELLQPPELQDSEPWSEALEVRYVAPPAVAPQPRRGEGQIDLDDQSPREIEVADAELEFDVPVELEAEPAFDSGAAPTVLRAPEVAPVPVAAELAEAAPWEPAVEVCTRPEPVMLRRATRAERAPVPAHVIAEPMPTTPTLGSLVAALPVLDRARIAELNLASSPPAAAIAPNEPEDRVLCSAAPEQTPQKSEVLPLGPEVALVESRKSCVSELVSAFQVGPDDSNQGLCRAIKEMADLELTPAPFSALVR